MIRKSENPTSGSRKIITQEVVEIDSNDTDINDTDINFEEEEINITASQNNLVRKVEPITQYDKDYIWNLVHDQLLKEHFSKTTADFAMARFDERYLYALENMRFARSPEVIAEYVFNGIISDFNQDMRKQHSM